MRTVYLGTSDFAAAVLERLGVVQPLGLDHLEAERARPLGHRRR